MVDGVWAQGRHGVAVGRGSELDPQLTTLNVALSLGGLMATLLGILGREAKERGSGLSGFFLLPFL